METSKSGSKIGGAVACHIGQDITQAMKRIAARWVRRLDRWEASDLKSMQRLKAKLQCLSWTSATASEEKAPRQRN